MSDQRSLEVLLEWCGKNSIHIDGRIDIRYGENTRQAVFARKEFIPAKTILVKIPKTAVLSTKTSSVAHLLQQQPFGLEAQLSLSLALYVEILKAKQSRFYGYLQSLPSGIVDLPIFWPLHGRTSTRACGDSSIALGWLSGTDAGITLSKKSEQGSTLLEEVTSFYYNVAVPLIRRLEMVIPDLLGFYRAFSLVSSRAFLVDAFHGLAMVPVADAFNHTTEHSVHLESDYDVCPECGSLDECSHDEETNPPRNSPDAADNDQHLEMVSNLAIPPEAEIFNTYGEQLSNAQLLNQYGFCLDVNRNDRLKWTLLEILDTLGQHTIDVHGNSQRDLHAVSTVLAEVATDSPSQLVFFEPRTTDKFLYCLNDEGSLSHELWSLLCILAFRHHRPADGRTLSSVVSSIWELQIWSEGNDNSDEEDYDTGSNSTSQSTRNPVPESVDPISRKLLQQMSSWVAELCSARKKRIGIPESWKLDLSDVMETFPQEYDRSRTAITLVMAEHSILDSCAAAWESIQSTILRLHLPPRSE